MCGISGILRFTNTPIEESVALKMRDSISHRGPDGAGLYINGRIALGHRRLSIIDVSDNGKQPFFSADSRYAIVFNGEIYNYKEFIPELEKRGVKFHSSSDTEVLLYLYIFYGPAMLNRLNGMWAFAVWDNVEQTLFLCRDRMGVKPLYYSIHNNTLYFASEQKAIFSAGVPCKIENNRFHELFFYRYVAGANTFYQNVFKLLPGHYMNIDAGGKLHIERYWHLGDRASLYSINEDVSEWFEYYFNRSIRYRMVSDVPVGILLSGGLDSSSVTLSAAQQGYKNLDTFTVSFTEEDLNETHIATKLAERLNFKPHELLVEGDLLYDNLIRSIWSHDEPLIHQSDPHLAAIADYSKKHVKVLLSGEGADELMGGYVRYKPLRYWNNLRFFSNFLNLPYVKNMDRFRKLLVYLKNRSIDEAILLNASNFFPEGKQNEAFEDAIQYRKQMLNEAKEYVGVDPVKQALYLDQHTYMVSLLERNDRATMSAGIECREPFLDANIVEGLMSLPASYFGIGKKGKIILLNSIGRKLPERIQNFKKIGLGVPWERYLRENEKFRSVLESLNDSELLNSEFFRPYNQKGLVDKFLAGDNSQKMLMRFLFFFRMWEIEYYSKF